ncbi:MAG: putative 2OG-Fe(II) oxygenase [Pseudomonadota bacterium]
MGKTITPSASALLQMPPNTTPDHPQAWLKLGRALAAEGRAAEAERAYREALKTQPGLRAARLALAQLLIRHGFPQVAIVEVQTLLDHDPLDADAWLTAGQAFRANYQPKEAHMAFSQALSARSSFAAASYALASLLLDKGEPENALAVLADTQTTDPQAAEQFQQLQARATAQADGPGLGPAAAEGLLLSSLERWPASEGLHTLLARLRYLRGDPGWSDLLQKAVDQQPQNLSLVRSCAAALRNGRQVQQALSLLEETLNATECSPSDGRAKPTSASRLITDLLLERADCYLSLGDPESALAVAQTACARDPERVRLSRQLLDAQLSAGCAQDVLPVIEEARERLPDHPRLLGAHITALRAVGDPLGDQMLDLERLVQVHDMPSDLWRSICRPLAQELAALHGEGWAPLDLSVRGGSQTLRSLLNCATPALVRLRQFFSEALTAYQASQLAEPGRWLGGSLKGEPILVGCWSVRLEPGGFHVNHLHSEGVVSSAFYVSVPELIDPDDPHAGELGFGAPRFAVPGVGVKRWVRPQPGRLVLFPSWLWHGTRSFKGKALRLTVAFDARFR